MAPLEQEHPPVGEHTVAADRTVEMVVITVAAGEAELAADALWRLGARGVEEVRLPDGAVELRAAVGETAPDVATALAGWSWTRRRVDARLASSWRDHAVPIEVLDDLVVAPAWVVTPTGSGVTTVVIDPGGSFGLGDHPSTILAVRHTDDAVRRRPGCSVADIGCGSGVVGIAAALRGARVVDGVDISASAVDAARRNAARNGVAGSVHISSTPADQLVGLYDVVVANILAPTLIALASTLRRLTHPFGALVVSGVLDGAFGHVVEALSPMEVVSTSEFAGWAALTLAHIRP